MESLVILIHVMAAIGITGLVLIQHGKGADMGASFGSGASQTIFGSTGSGNVLTKSTSILATVFFITSLGLAVLARQQADQSVQDNSLIENISQISAGAAPNASAQDIPMVGENQSAGDIPQAGDPELSDLPEVGSEDQGETDTEE